MQLKIINKKEDPLLSRIKVESEIVFEKATPSREDIKNKLAEVLGKDKKLIAVKGIYTQYGLKKAKNLSYAYENEGFLKKIEVEKKKKDKQKNETKEEAEDKGKESEAEAKPEDQKPKEGKAEEKKDTKEQKGEEVKDKA